jgi:hypothetical protein
MGIMMVDPLETIPWHSDVAPKQPFAVFPVVFQPPDALPPEDVAHSHRVRTGEVVSQISSTRRGRWLPSKSDFIDIRQLGTSVG